MMVLLEVRRLIIHDKSELVPVEIINKFCEMIATDGDSLLIQIIKTVMFNTAQYLFK